jgi:hypothetical protein
MRFHEITNINDPDTKTTYYVERYTELLTQSCKLVIEPFGHTIHINNCAPLVFWNNMSGITISEFCSLIN